MDVNQPREKNTRLNEPKKLPDIHITQQTRKGGSTLRISGLGITAPLRLATRTRVPSSKNLYETFVGNLKKKVLFRRLRAREERGGWVRARKEVHCRNTNIRQEKAYSLQCESINERAPWWRTTTAEEKLVLAG